MLGPAKNRHREENKITVIPFEAKYCSFAILCSAYDDDINMLRRTTDLHKENVQSSQMASIQHLVILCY